MLKISSTNGRPIAALAFVIAFVVTGRTGADTANKQLQNIKGNVSFQLPAGTPQTLAPQATIVLADSDYAITGNVSLGAITLPDSSQVLIGSQTKIQLAFFNQAQIANAKFILYQGKTRFQVEHPTGRQANYTFDTPSAEIGVRGTQGDILTTPATLRVNVYELSNTALPVIVKFNDGRSFTVSAGQGLVADLTIVPASVKVTPLTPALETPFTEFGAPPSQAVARNKHSWLWSALINSIINSAVNSATAPSNSAGNSTSQAPSQTPAQNPPPESSTIPK